MYLPLLGIIIFCLPLILKLSLILCFNISSVLKACKQYQQKCFLSQYKVLYFASIILDYA